MSDTKPDWWARAIAAATLAIGIYVAKEQAKSNGLNQKALDTSEETARRAAGKIQSRLTLVGNYPKWKDAEGSIKVLGHGWCVHPKSVVDLKALDLRLLLVN